MELKPFKYYGASGTLIRKHLKSVLDGEYNSRKLGEALGRYPRVLDLGANVGTFAYWVIRSLPNAHVYSYEPIAENVRNYLRNLKTAGISEHNYTLTQAAVYPGDTDMLRIYTSPINSGMHSAFVNMTGGSEQVYVDVIRVDPVDLPIADFIKLDTEGCEINILREYLRTHPLPKAVSFEFHNAFDRYELEEMLGEHYLLHSGKIVSPDLGVLNFLRNDIK